MRPLPRRSNIRRYAVLRHFGPLLSSPRLWGYDRRSLLVAIWAGSLITMQPIMGVQIPLAFAAMLWLRGNLTLAVGLQMLSNPLTAGPLYGATYVTGDYLLTRLAPADTAGAWAIPQSLAVGGFLGGIVLAILLHAALLVATTPRRPASVSAQKIHSEI